MGGVGVGVRGGEGGGERRKVAQPRAEILADLRIGDESDATVSTDAGLATDLAAGLARGFVTSGFGSGLARERTPPLAALAAPLAALAAPLAAAIAAAVAAAAYVAAGDGRRTSFLGEGLCGGGGGKRVG